MYEDFNYTGGTGEDDFESNLFNDAPTENWYTDTYGMDDLGGYFNTQEPQFDLNTSIPEGTWNMAPNQSFGGGEIGIPTPEMDASTMQGGWDTQGLQDTLAKLFNNKGAISGLGAIVEGMQNKKKAKALQDLATRYQGAMDPFGGQRAFYQQQLQQAVQDPYSAPIVKSQVDQLQRAQAIKDAAAGRRSNSATSNPALLAAQAAVAQKYMDSLQTPAGANISPSGLSSILGTRAQASNYDVNGMLSPILSALAKNAGTDKNTQTLDALRKFFGQQ